VLIRAERGERTAGELVGERPSSVSVVSVSELLYGAHRGRPEARGERLARVENLLARLTALPVSEPIARVHAQMWSELTARGQRIGIHDSWIAATALAHGLELVTTDEKDFGRVPGLRVRPI
jgi:predicted nucleic acid-binding protein